MLHQPGEAWLYNTCADILGVLVGRVSGTSFSEFLAERLFEPLGMGDTGFSVPEAKLGRLAGYYPETPRAGSRPSSLPTRLGTNRPLPRERAGSSRPRPTGTAFGRMLLAGGTATAAAPLGGVGAAMTTDHLTAEQRAASTLFLEGQGWGFGGSVDVEPIDPWNVPGRTGGSAAPERPRTSSRPRGRSRSCSRRCR